ncbi:MAG: PIN domain-containing protein [Chloroflexota bacterium]
MTSYSLDTNACMALINGRPIGVRERFRQAQQAGNSFVVSTVVVFELRYGVAKSQYPQASGARLELFLGRPLDVLPLDEDDAVDAGAARAALERAGTPIGAYDVLIAGQARRRSLTVVTANVSEFRRVADLSWEDWAR